MPNSRRIIRIVICMLLVYALLQFARAGRAAAEMEQTAFELQGELEQLELEHAALELQLREPPDPGQMEALARRELGMVMPGEIVFIFAGDGEETEPAGQGETEREPIWRWK